MTQIDTHERDLPRAVTCPCPECGRVNVPLANEPDIAYCLECGTDVNDLPHDCGEIIDRERKEVTK